MQSDLAGKILELLEDKLPEGASPDSVLVFKTDDNKYRVYAEIIVNGLLNIDPNVIDYEELGERCNREASSEEEWEQCVTSEIERWRKNTCRPPFLFAYSTPSGVVAALSTVEEDDVYKLVCYVALKLSIEVQHPSADRIVADIVRVVEALKVLVR